MISLQAVKAMVLQLQAFGHPVFITQPVMRLSEDAVFFTLPNRQCDYCMSSVPCRGSLYAQAVRLDCLESARTLGDVLCGTFAWP